MWLRRMAARVRLQRFRSRELRDVRLGRVQSWVRRLIFGQPVERCNHCGGWFGASHVCPKHTQVDVAMQAKVIRAHEARLALLHQRTATTLKALAVVDEYLTLDNGRLDAIEEFITRPTILDVQDGVAALRADYENLRLLTLDNLCDVWKDFADVRLWDQRIWERFAQLDGMHSLSRVDRSKLWEFLAKTDNRVDLLTDKGR